MKTTRVVAFVSAIALWALAAAVPSFAEPRSAAPESKRMAQAKDLIADEQWPQAVEVLRAAANDPKEPNRDEALFWLAHSQHQVRDTLGALETIQRLERDYRASRWVKPARSLRIEIAQRQRRNDVLWYTAAPPPPPPAPPAPVPAAPPAPPAAAAPRAVPTPRATIAPAPPAPPAPPRVWLPEGYVADTDLRIQALASLIQVDASRAVPMLKSIALETGNVVEARRALFALAHSGTPLARSTVVEVAKTGSEPVRIAAVRELGRVAGPEIQNELLDVYLISTDRVKYEVVSSLGERAAAGALVRIVQSERQKELRERAEEELIAIAERERDPAVRREVLERLRKLGTPRAKAYLEREQRKR